MKYFIEMLYEICVLCEFMIDITFIIIGVYYTLLIIILPIAIVISSFIPDSMPKVQRVMDKLIQFAMIQLLEVYNWICTKIDNALDYLSKVFSRGE